jgi:hypothetical protein
MKQILAAAAIAALSASAANAMCSHMTTAQSTSPELVAAEDAATPMTTVREGIDDTLTGSTSEDLLIKKPLPVTNTNAE